MAEVVLFHHVQGLTDGVEAFAERLRAVHHVVHTPDLFDGTRPTTLEEGLAYELVETVGPELAELYVYPGDRHLFTDSSLPSYDAEATTEVLQHSLALLERVDRG